MGYLGSLQVRTVNSPEQTVVVIDIRIGVSIVLVDLMEVKFHAELVFIFCIAITLCNQH